jgi:hypothetical protein
MGGEEADIWYQNNAYYRSLYKMAGFGDFCFEIDLSLTLKLKP